MVQISNRIKLWLILVISICVLSIVFLVEFGLGLEPCILCKYQRIPYFAAILFTGMALHIKTANQVGTLDVICVIFILSVVLAFYHYGIEQHWWEVASGCGDFDRIPMNFEDFKSQLLAKLPKRCDEIDWTLFGLSMSGYNFLVSIGLVVFSLPFNLFHKKI